MTRPELNDTFRILLGRHIPGPVSQRLVEDLVDAASQYTAARIEETCRPYPWPPVRRRELGENKQQRGEEAS